jgi:protein O-GlcNAc transferase
MQQIDVNAAEAERHLAAARACWRQQKYPEAEAECHAVLRTDPANAEALLLVGRVLHVSGRSGLALPFLTRAVALNPGSARFWRAFARLQIDLGGYDDAFEAARRASELEASHAGNDLLCGLLHLETFRSNEAIRAFERALEKRPDSLEAILGLATGLARQGRIPEAALLLRRSIEEHPGFAAGASMLLFLSHLLPGLTDVDVAAATRTWVRAAGLDIDREPSPFLNSRDPGKRLRLGYVSGDFRSHPVGLFLLPALEHRDRDRFEVFCYSNGSTVDAHTRRIRELADGWRILVGTRDERAAEIIRADGIDLLVDLSGHTALNRLALFGLRPAPVQAHWIGYFGTTGVPAIGSLVADPHVVPAGSEAHYVERIERMPHDFLCFRPRAEWALEDPPSRARGYVTFGCFNRAVKINGDVAALWAEILRRVPGSRLMLKCDEFRDADAIERYGEMLESAGIDRSRTVLEGSSPFEEYIRLHGEIDVMLDPFPFNGGTTTIDALWMGVPVVSLAGDRFASRMGRSHLTAVGLADLVADSASEYVRIAAELALDPGRLLHLRRSIRGMMLGSPLCDGPGYTRALEAIYRGMWARWCESEPA